MIFLPVICYAEIHYRFKYFFSYLLKKEPEILFDAPHRIEPDSNLPILLYVKDAHLFPIEVISVELKLENEIQQFYYKFYFNTWVDNQFWDEIITINFSDKLSKLFGWFKITATLNYSCNGKLLTCKIDNYKVSSKKPLNVFRSKHFLPRLPNSKSGDLHTHSNFTNDQVEFGATLKSAAILSKSIGLDFFCATDHSYDLDDEQFNYLKNDPKLQKWNSFLSEVNEINESSNKFKIIFGEELSSRNSDGKNVHLLLLNQKNLLIGEGDSAEKWFRTNSKYNITDAINLKNRNAIAIAAHPKEEVPFLQKILFGRNNWKKEDFSINGLTGFQILNGIINNGFEKGKNSWIEELLIGRKVFVYGGTDAHGNFNRFRQLKIPFFSIEESDKQLFGSMRTVIISSSLKVNNLITNLKSGNCVVTTGPLIIISKSINNKLNIKINTTLEFGRIDNIKLFLGNIGSKKELLYFQQTLKLNKFNFDKTKINLPQSGKYYIRGELKTTSGIGLLSENICLTNPIWFNY